MMFRCLRSNKYIWTFPGVANVPIRTVYVSVKDGFHWIVNFLLNVPNRNFSEYFGKYAAMWMKRTQSTYIFLGIHCMLWSLDLTKFKKYSFVFYFLRLNELLPSSIHCGMQYRQYTIQPGILCMVYCVQSAIWHLKKNKSNEKIKIQNVMLFSFWYWI